MEGIIHNCRVCNKDFLINIEFIIKNRTRHTKDENQIWYCFNCYIKDRTSGILEELRDYQLIEMLNKYPDLPEETRKKAEVLLVAKIL
jgi:hypothetical protein